MRGNVAIQRANALAIRVTCIGMWGRLRGITCERQPYLLVDADDVLKFECLGIVLVVPTNDDNPVVSRVIDL